MRGGECLTILNFHVIFQIYMDTVFAQAVTKIIGMPQETQRVIGEALLDGAGQPDLPIIEFTAEENEMIDESVEQIERGEVISQEEVKKRFDELRAKSYEAI